MEAIFLKLVNMSITASWLVLAIVAVRLVFRKTPKWILCLLWGLVAIRLICPFSIESSLSLIPSTEPLPQDIIYTAESVKQARGDILDSNGNVILERRPLAARGEILDSSGNVVLEKNLTPVDGDSANPTQSWSTILSRIWIIGSAIMLLYTVLSYLLLKRKVATAIPLEKGVKQSEFVDSPFVLGILHPVIYLPFVIEEGDMAYVLAHEKAHIRRHDHWWKPMGFLLLSIYWFNPVMWVAYILLCRDIEAACDEKVVRDMETDDRRAYSTALLNCSIHRRRIAACPLAFGETGVKIRVKNVMNYKKPAFWVILIALIICIVVAVCFLTNPVSEEEQEAGYHYIESVTAQDGYQIINQESVKVNLVIGKDKLPADCYTLKGHTFEVKEVIPYQTYADNILYLKHVGIDKERSEYLRFTFAFQTGSLEKENLLLPYHVDGNGFVCNVEVNRGEVWDNQGTYENAAYFEPVTNGEGFCVLVKKAICEAAGHHIAFMLNDMNRLTFEERQIDSPVTITAENANPTGVKILFHQNEDLIDGSLICGHEFFLQQKINGQWENLPTIEGAEFPDQSYDIALLHHHGIDWKWMYGKLDVGSYRLGKEIPITSGENPEYTTVYAEFTIDNVYTWFDRYSTDVSEYGPKEDTVSLFGMDGVALSYYTNQIKVVTPNGTEPVISCDLIIRNVFLTDLTGDGVSEICATVQNETGIGVQIYDYVAKQLYELPPGEDYTYILAKKADRLCVLQHDSATWRMVSFGPLAVTEAPLGSGKKLEMQELDGTLEAMTKTVFCVDIETRKHVCLSTPKEIETIISLLHNLEKQVQPAPAEKVKKAQEDHFDNSSITINYELGEKILYFSKDFSLVWESGSEEGHLIQDPEPLLTYVESVTNGVRGQETSGEPFAAVDAPWDWCAGISANAVESAQAHICLYTYSNGTGGGSSATNGSISYDTLQDLIDVLNQIPKEAFVKTGTLVRESYHSYFINQQKENSAVSVLDGVNGIAAVIRYCEGTVEMVLTDEMDKVKQDDMTYLEATSIWRIQDQRLLEFMQEVSEHPPVITYSVGAEYDWQDPIDFTSGSFSLSLRLPVGWEYEQVSNAGSSGIRCRPEGIAEGWLYFSWWPGGYETQEENRYYSEGSWMGYPTTRSYPGSVKTATSLDTRNAIWSYYMADTDYGHFVIINEGADVWFLEYKDQITDMISLSNFTIE